MPGPEQNGLFVRAFHLDAVSFHVRVVLQRLMHHAAVEGVHRLQFDDVSPTANFVSSFLCAFDQGVSGLRAVAAHIQGDLRGTMVLLEDHPVDQILELGQGLALAPDEPPGIVAFDVQKEAVVHMVLLDSGLEAEQTKELFGGFFGVGGHGDG